MWGINTLEMFVKGGTGIKLGYYLDACFEEIE
jgi:hypothetical protein